MDTGSGHIYDLSTMEIPSIKGKMVEWKVGEKVEVKDCLFEVVEIKCIPEDKIILKGLAKQEIVKKLFQELDKLPPVNDISYKEGLEQFLKNK